MLVPNRLGAKLSIFTMLVSNCPISYYGARLSVCLLGAKLSVFSILVPNYLTNVTQPDWFEFSSASKSDMDGAGQGMSTNLWGGRGSMEIENIEGYKSLLKN